jgi:GTP-binding protein LepA
MSMMQKSVIQLTHLKNGAAEPLPGYKEVKPMVYSGLYPTDSDEFEDLRDALEKFRLNDSALVYQPETSAALGFRFQVRISGTSSYGDRSGKIIQGI